MQRFLKRMKRVGLLTMSILGLGSATAREAHAVQSLETAPVSQKADNESDWSLVTNEAFQLDETGAIEFRPSFVFAPLQAERTVETESLQSLSARLDLPVALQFAQDPAVLEKMTEQNQEYMRIYFEQALVDQFADKVRGLNVLPDDHDLTHGKSEDVHVTSVRIIGGASPEAQNPDSITPGNVEWENIETAWARASTQAPIVIEQLMAQGMTPEALSRVSIE
ncbi:TPA: hypothetical protein DEB00_03660, partial [Candidatus Uhrbacteria bacterium]|nr:hypothetical protein [Candidatus Uhrbacteria bacterium]